jgi:hypothetical protein
VVIDGAEVRAGLRGDGTEGRDLEAIRGEKALGGVEDGVFCAGTVKWERMDGGGGRDCPL